MLRHAQSFKDLVVYQKAKRVADTIYLNSKKFPKEEMYSLTDQIRRSSRAIGAQIAEAWGKRRYEKHFVSKLTDADAEQLETQHWIDTAVSSAYWTEQMAEGLLKELDEIGRMLHSMMAKADLFCGDGNREVCETQAEYFTSTEH